jgi:hypothetical protein
MKTWAANALSYNETESVFSELASKPLEDCILRSQFSALARLVSGFSTIGVGAGLFTIGSFVPNSKTTSVSSLVQEIAKTEQKRMNIILFHIKKELIKY